ncbi:MAG: LURP-one-related family protein [Phycisphaerales bacterium]|nr:MAG: LURP-one-related family protein [Phycisphaerales bacterium]
MRYVMKQKLFALGKDFYIRDEAGHDLFFVKGKVFSIGHKLAFQDLNGNELAFIKQKLISIAPKYELYRDGRLVAVVKKKLFTFVKSRFTLDMPGPGGLEVEGDFLQHEYSFTRQGYAVAWVSKKWFSWTDTYGVDIAEGEDDVLILATTVVIDMVCHQKDAGAWGSD